MLSKQIVFAVALLSLPLLAHADAVDTLLEQYRQQGAGDFSSDQGEMSWKQSNQNTKSGKKRSCTDCHTSDLSMPGKHAKTGKKIDPMAPSANSKRLTDSKKIEKWFKRNCHWTLGRACTPQERGDFLVYLRQQ